MFHSGHEYFYLDATPCTSIDIAQPVAVEWLAYLDAKPEAAS